MSRIEHLARNEWPRTLRSVLGLEHGVGYRLVEAVRASRTLTYALRLSRTSDLKKVIGGRMEEAIALALGVEGVRIARRLGQVCLQIELPPDFHRPLLVRSLRRKSHLWLTLGKTTLGEQVHINLGGSRYAHALVAATTGAGKTETMKLALWEMAMQNRPDEARFLLIDGKGGGDWHGFRHLPHLFHAIVDNPRDALGALAWAVAEADRRKENGRREPALLLFVDEIAELLAQTGGQEGAAAQALQRLTQIGRSLNIHCILATQHPTAAVLGGSISKANLPLRLVGRVLNSHASYLASGQKQLGAERLYGEGDFLAVAGSASHRLQVALVDERYMARLPRNGGRQEEIDLTLDLERVLGVADVEDGDAGLKPEWVAWALTDYFNRRREAGGRLDRPSANAVRKHFGIATDTAREVRDFAIDVLSGLREEGYLLTPSSPDTPKQHAGDGAESE